MDGVLKFTSGSQSTKGFAFIASIGKLFGDGGLQDMLTPAPGSDGVTNEMLIYLGREAKKVLLQIFNQSWKYGQIPTKWKEAIIIPIHKKGKDKSSPKSYRPISLLSCVGKLMERIVKSD